jgi:bifunctional pyridoxal-dependent enzyme with beta-cystathionase and maltose regulon repressor activities
MKPEAGVFVFVDLRDFLKENIQLNEYLIFKKMFYEYKVNASCGLDYKSPEPGFFRICTVIDEESIKEGIRRLGLMIKGEPFF